MCALSTFKKSTQWVNRPNRLMLQMFWKWWKIDQIYNTVSAIKSTKQFSSLKSVPIKSFNFAFHTNNNASDCISLNSFAVLSYRKLKPTRPFHFFNTKHILPLPKLAGTVHNTKTVIMFLKTCLRVSCDFVSYLMYLFGNITKYCNTSVLNTLQFHSPDILKLFCCNLPSAISIIEECKFSHMNLNLRIRVLLSCNVFLELLPCFTI